MDPLITNGIEPVMLRGLEKRADEHDVPRRKRPSVRVKTVEAAEEEYKEESGPDIPQHKLDDLA
jgi:hypothetical protein